ncbi:PREDICTED: chymotrypsin-1-like [Ceratosolen solmsi marchali]|uniref:Chymotrypsin-1-like n=1 Tax=Ceratosolen solmsi marchali TaxID=326594 RepID=A0AAJ7E2P6_9HYME|nr:PREDICTED: chymotrypsin-1-like [Ceratosolen solmsi marchali]
MSFKLVIFLFISVCTGTFGKHHKIVGGKDAQVKDFPHSASIREADTKNYHCGGSIISNKHILTAAHCFFDYDPTAFIVYVGKSNFDVRVQSHYAIENCLVHPQFTEEETRESMLLYDIAIVTLAVPIEFTRYQNKIKLAYGNPPVNGLVTLTAWGAVATATRTHPKRLQKASFRVLSNYECSLRVQFVVRSQHLCIFSDDAAGACYGDSGSGLIFNGELVAVASFVQPCAEGKPDVYTRVQPYLNFITNRVHSN